MAQAVVENTTCNRVTILVTGGNKGIGLEFCKMCLQEHSNIALIVGCRSLNRIIMYDKNKSKKQLRKDPEFSKVQFNDSFHCASTQY